MKQLFVRSSDGQLPNEPRLLRFFMYRFDENKRHASRSSIDTLFVACAIRICNIAATKINRPINSLVQLVINAQQNWKRKQCMEDEHVGCTPGAQRTSRNGQATKKKWREKKWRGKIVHEKCFGLGSVPSVFFSGRIERWRIIQWNCRYPFWSCSHTEHEMCRVRVQLCAQSFSSDTHTKKKFPPNLCGDKNLLHTFLFAVEKQTA